MEMNAKEIVDIITQTINNVGFPIAVAGCLFWYIIKIENKQSEALTKLTEAVNKLLDRLKN